MDKGDTNKETLRGLVVGVGREDVDGKAKLALDEAFVAIDKISSEDSEENIRKLLVDTLAKIDTVMGELSSFGKMSGVATSLRERIKEAVTRAALDQMGRINSGWTH